MKLSIKKGFSFGLTSGIITTLGLMVGLHSTTNSELAVIGGVLVIAIADALSDSLGVHVSEEAEIAHTHKEIWESTAATFVSKFVMAMTFVVPIMIFDLGLAIIVSIIWGFSLIGIFSYFLAKQQKMHPIHVIGEHLLISTSVVVITHYVGDLVARLG